MIGRLLRRPPPPDERARSRWYRAGEYVNYDEDVSEPRLRSLAKFLRWRVSRVLQGRGAADPRAVEGAADTPVEVRPLAPEDLAPPGTGLRVAWLGHASLAIVAPRLRIVLDPLFGGPPLVPRLAPPPIAAEGLPPQDLLLLTHNHYDHLDLPSIRALRARAPALRAIVPSGLAGFVRGLGIADVRPLEWWETVEVEGVRVTAVPARHWSQRALLDTRQSHWCGFLVEADGRRLYVAGDTAWGGHFDAIAARHAPPHAAVLPIGGYSPRWFMRDRHIDPPEAVAAARTLRAEVMLPVHWGALRLADEPLGEPPLYAERAAETAGQPLRLWRPGDVHEV